LDVWKMKKQGVFLLTLFLIACGPVTPVPQTITVTPVIEFQTPNIRKYSEEDVKQDGVDLFVGISSVNKDIVFLFGGMSDRNAFNAQSTLLRSEDGGIHWKEVMAPISESSVTEFTMLESGVGWALIWGGYDASDKYALFQTVDYGINWKEISAIPMSSKNFTIPLQMIFTDELQGQIDILYEGEYLEFLTTKDGGLNWKQAGMYKPDFDFRSNAKILDSYRSLIRDKSESFNFDHSGFWTLDGSDPDTHNIVIRRYVYDDQFYDEQGGMLPQEEILFPNHFDYQDGQIIVP
jgi:hypothetical protein